MHVHLLVRLVCLITGKLPNKITPKIRSKIIKSLSVKIGYKIIKRFWLLVFSTFCHFFYLGCNQLDMQSHLLITNNFDRNLTIFTYISFHDRYWSLNRLFRLFCLLRFRHNSFSVKYSASTYFRLELIEPSAREVFIFWTLESRGEENMVQP